jgi:anthranilate 1,2-dioxygenase large subunit/terephthalate 1,2-dioxygenase oxygenase component alpha subunit
MDDAHALPAAARERLWPAGISRVPYWLYQDPEILRAEQKRIFEGPAWHFLCLEVDIGNEGDYRTTHVGEMPVIVVRGKEGRIHAFENRCAHRGALIAFDDAGSVKDFTCAYHAWRYDLEGNLCSIAFQRGVNGKGGMPAEFRMEQHGPRKLRVESIGGLVFGSVAPSGPSLEEYLSPEIAARIRRVFNRKLEVLGRFTQFMPNNWKLYAENIRDTYHASLLHLFFTTFKITRFDQAGGVTISPSGAHHASATIGKGIQTQSVYKDQGIRSDSDDFRLRDDSFLASTAEFGDDIQLQNVALFPATMLQQLYNSIAVRQTVPRGVEGMDLNWIFLGFADDTPEVRRMRLKQMNLAGPAGYVSMEDGIIGNFVQRGAAAAGGEIAVVEMGGYQADSQNTRATEASVRGFWKAYRSYMGM